MLKLWGRLSAWQSELARACRSSNGLRLGGVLLRDFEFAEASRLELNVLDW
jgi:hypothetical protein